MFVINAIGKLEFRMKIMWVCTSRQTVLVLPVSSSPCAFHICFLISDRLSMLTRNPFLMFVNTTGIFNNRRNDAYRDSEMISGWMLWSYLLKGQLMLFKTSLVLCYWKCIWWSSVQIWRRLWKHLCRSRVFVQAAFKMSWCVPHTKMSWT